MVRGIAITLASATVLIGCDWGSAPDKQAERPRTEASEPKPIDGLGQIKFGSSVMDAIGSLGVERFNPASFKECLDDLPVYGCDLYPDSDAAPFEFQDGVPYKLSLSFNQFDKLTDISLGYRRERSITKADCLSIHERMIDFVTRQFGRLYWNANRADGQQIRKTQAGNEYLIWFSKDGSFVTAPSRTFSGHVSPALQKKPIPTWDDERNVWTLSSFILAGAPYCDVTLTISEPPTVARPKKRPETDLALKNLDTRSDEFNSESASSGANGIVEDDGYEPNDTGE